MLPVSFISLVAKHLEWLFAIFNGMCSSQLKWIFFFLLLKWSEKAGDALVLSKCSIGHETESGNKTAAKSALCYY